MGIARVRGLVAAVLAVAPLILWTPTPAVADAPSGTTSGCGVIKYRRVDGAIKTAALCGAPGNSAFHSGGRGTASDPGCPMRIPKTNPDGTPMVDPDNPGAYLEEDTFGQWQYSEMSGENVVPIGADPPHGADFTDWVNSFPTYQQNAGGDRVFLVTCLAGGSSYYVDRVNVSADDPFWLDLPAQLEAVRAKVPLAAPQIGFRPGGPGIWGGFLINAPYAVSLRTTSGTRSTVRTSTHGKRGVSGWSPVR
jgi:hypothetical protein